MRCIWPSNVAIALQVAGRYRGELAKEAARDAKRRAAERKAASGGARRAAAAEAS